MLSFKAIFANFSASASLEKSVWSLYWGSIKFFSGRTILVTDWAQKTSLTKLVLKCSVLSGEFWVPQANQDLVKIRNLYFPYWAWSTPWGHVLSLITFRQIPVLSWAIRYSVFQKVKFTSSFQKWAGHFNSNSWHLVVKFGHNGWF